MDPRIGRGTYGLRVYPPQAHQELDLHERMKLVRASSNRGLMRGGKGGGRAGRAQMMTRQSTVAQQPQNVRDNTRNTSENQVTPGDQPECQISQALPSNDTVNEAVLVEAPPLCVPAIVGRRAGRKNGRVDQDVGVSLKRPKLN